VKVHIKHAHIRGEKIAVTIWRQDNVIPESMLRKSKKKLRIVANQSKNERET